MYYPLHDVKSLANVLFKMGYVYMRPSQSELGSWVAKSLTVLRNFLETAVFEKILEVANIKSLSGYLYDPIGFHIPVLAVGKSPFLTDDIYDVLLIGGKYGNLVVPYLLVAYNRAVLKLKSYEIDRSVWTNTLYNDPVFMVLSDGFYIDWRVAVIDETAVPREDVPLVFKREVTVKIEEMAPSEPAPETSTPETSTPESSTPESSIPDSSTPESSTPESSTPESPTPSPSPSPSPPNSKPSIWEDKELLFSIATLLFTVIMIMVLCDVASGEFYAILFV